MMAMYIGVSRIGRTGSSIVFTSFRDLEILPYLAFIPSYFRFLPMFAPLSWRGLTPYFFSAISITFASLLPEPAREVKDCSCIPTFSPYLFFFLCRAPCVARICLLHIVIFLPLAYLV
ncbi:hypothetical protein B0J11DRAFT_64447 [Dendryphion nanum]|uniref:Uncharacterized protein n=1 Tax=Dendryphion nanum TaxID=256645 RepID=A0A9P9DI06_9PLEO|nr:hypothetical protein B0J11DRAFT_64447 [Dendryphion nanum]